MATENICVDLKGNQVLLDETFQKNTCKILWSILLGNKRQNFCTTFRKLTVAITVTYSNHMPSGTTKNKFHKGASKMNIRMKNKG